MQQLSPSAVIHLLETLPCPDRRLDCEIARLLAAPAAARLAAKAAPEGWDIVVEDPQGDELVCLAAVDVPHSTAFLDAALELINAAMPERATTIVRRGVAARILTSEAEDPGGYLNGGLARAILAEAVRSAASAAAAMPRAA